MGKRTATVRTLGVSKWPTVSIRLTDSQIEQLSGLIEAQGRQEDRAIFFVVPPKSYQSPDLAAQLVSVDWKTAQKVVGILKKGINKTMDEVENLITRGKITRAQKGTIYTPEGVGKTSLIFPDMIRVDTERGSDHVDTPRIVVNTPAEWERALTALLNNKHNFKTVAIDTVDWLEKILAVKVCEKKSHQSIEDFGYGKGWVILREEFDKMLFRLDGFIDRGISVVFLAHSQVKRMQPPEASDGYDRYILKLDQRNAERLKEWSDFVLFGNFVTNVKESTMGKTTATGGRERRFYTVHTAAYDAKNRVGLDEKMPFKIESLAPLFPALSAPAATEPAAPTISPRPAFIALMEGYDRDLVDAFWTARGTIAADQNHVDVPEETMRRVLANPERFEQEFDKYASKSSTNSVSA